MILRAQNLKFLHNQVSEVVLPAPHSYAVVLTPSTPQNMTLCRNTDVIIYNGEQ